MLRCITTIIVFLMSMSISEASDVDRLDKPRTSFSGAVIKGDQQARQLGCPTANIKIEQQPQAGVYACTVEYDGKTYNAMGYTDDRRPTVLEAHLFDFTGDMYGKDITVNLLHFIRAPVEFTTTDKMKSLLAMDQVRCLNAYKAYDQLTRLPLKMRANWVAANLKANYLAPELCISVFNVYLKALRDYEAQKLNDPNTPSPPLDYQAYLG